MNARICVLWLGLVVALGLSAGDLRAQGPRGRLVAPRVVPEVGARVGWDWDAEAVTVGGQVRIPMGPGGALTPSGDFRITGEGTQWQVNVDLLVAAGPGGLFCIGTGAALMHRQLEKYGIEDPAGPRTKLGLNIVFGVGAPLFRRFPVIPYAEIRVTAVSKYDASQWLSVGLNVPLGWGAASRR